MTFNEINNQTNTSADIFGWTDSGVLFSQYKNKKKAMYQAAHHEMVAGCYGCKKKDIRSIPIFGLDACVRLSRFIHIPAIRMIL
mgnify:CR=1 FL=1